jgi:hypothetical protein
VASVLVRQRPSSRIPELPIRSSLSARYGHFPLRHRSVIGGRYPGWTDALSRESIKTLGVLVRNGTRGHSVRSPIDACTAGSPATTGTALRQSSKLYYHTTGRVKRGHPHTQAVRKPGGEDSGASTPLGNSCQHARTLVHPPWLKGSQELIVTERFELSLSNV